MTLIFKLNSDPLGFPKTNVLLVPMRYYPKRPSSRDFLETRSPSSLLPGKTDDSSTINLDLSRTSCGRSKTRLSSQLNREVKFVLLNEYVGTCFSQKLQKTERFLTIHPISAGLGENSKGSNCNTLSGGDGGI